MRDVLQKVELQVLIDARHKPPVEDAQPAVLGPQQVARMRVAVQQSGREEHRKVCVEGDAAQLRDVVRLRALEPLALDPSRDELCRPFVSVARDPTKRMRTRQQASQRWARYEQWAECTHQKGAAPSPIKESLAWRVKERSTHHHCTEESN